MQTGTKVRIKDSTKSIKAGKVGIVTDHFIHPDKEVVNIVHFPSMDVAIHLFDSEIRVSK